MAIIAKGSSFVPCPAGLHQAVCCDVIDLGIVPTPVTYFAAHHLGCRSAVMLTGSHNPGEYNGLKMMIAGETLHGEGIQSLRQRIEDGRLDLGAIDYAGALHDPVAATVFCASAARCLSTSHTAAAWARNLPMFALPCPPTPMKPTLIRSLAPWIDPYDLALKPIPPIAMPAVPSALFLIKSLRLFFIFRRCLVFH